MSTVVTLKINDQDVSGLDDETILQVAQEHDINIPTLCHLENLTDIGACRLCLVEIKGSPKLVPACVVRVREGMEVYTNTKQLQKYRRTLVELLFTEGNHICSVCVVNGHCELQNMAVALGIDHINMPPMHPVRTVDASHERFALDRNRCILCTRCVRVCAEVEGAHTWDVSGRGVESCVITDLNQPWSDAVSCTSCGKCVQVCPTGALFIKGRAVGEMTKHRSFLTSLALMRENGK
jgi:bidirectional [NiFe] hydrogenase diaphorase subunit